MGSRPDVHSELAPQSTYQDELPKVVLIAMMSEFNDTLQNRLREAEMAEDEVQRLRSLAEEAPLLRLRKANEERYRERLRIKHDAISRARAAVKDSHDKQSQVSDFLVNAALAVGDLYTLLKSIADNRNQAAEALAELDRVDYDIELEEIEGQENSMGRDSRGLDYVLAARHGEHLVNEMLEDLDPGFYLLRGCNLDDYIYRELAEFVVKQAAPDCAR